MPPLRIPVTRYYGSKRKLVEKIWNIFDELELEFDSVLDIFGGSAIFSYYAKTKNKTVIYNDIFKFNYLIGKALIENNNCNLTPDDFVNLTIPKDNVNYDSIVEDNYFGIYFTEEENKIIDIVVQNIQFLNEENKAFAYYVLFQACLIKRPFNLFHRKNLSLRLNHTKSNFGNKKTWEHSFEDLFYKFSQELQLFVFNNGRNNLSVNYSALNCPVNANLIYIDPPYFSMNGSHITYHSRYHFLEGLANYNQIEQSLSNQKANKEILINDNSEFEVKLNFLTDLSKLIERYQNSVIAISYCSPGYPTIDDIANVVRTYKQNCHIANLGDYSYALNRSNKGKREFLIVGY